MARIRTVKPEFFKHEELFELEKETKLPVRVAFIALWTVADREGRFKWRPNQLKLDCLPYDIVDFSRVLDALATRGFITEFCETGVKNAEKYGFINTFTQNQVINNRETESLIPCAFDACMTRDPRGLCGTQWKGREGKGREGSKKDYSDDFLTFYQAYPNKSGKDKAFESWKKMQPNLSEVLSAIEFQSKSPQWIKNNGEFVPMASTWINQSRWKDEISNKSESSQFEGVI